MLITTQASWFRFTFLAFQSCVHALIIDKGLAIQFGQIYFQNGQGKKVSVEWDLCSVGFLTRRFDWSAAWWCYWRRIFFGCQPSDLTNFESFTALYSCWSDGSLMAWTGQSRQNIKINHVKRTKMKWNTLEIASNFAFSSIFDYKICFSFVCKV